MAKQLVTIGDAAGAPPNTLSAADLARFNAESAKSRLAVLAVFFSAFSLFHLFVPGGDATLGLSLRAIILPCLAGVALSLAVLFAPRLRRHPWIGFYLQMSVDLLTLTLGIHLAVEGATAVAGRLLYVLIIVPPSLVSQRAANWTTAACVVAHLLLIGGEYGFTRQAFATGAAVGPALGFVLIAMMASSYGGYIGETNLKLRRLAEHLESSRGRLAGLVDLAKMLNSSADVDVLTENVNLTARREFRADWCATYRIDTGRGEFHQAAASERSGRGREAVRLADWPVLERLSRDGVAIVARDAIAAMAGAFRIPEPFSTLVLAALSREEEMVGFLALGYVGERPRFSDADLSQIAALAEHATIALHNARLLEEAREASALKTEFLSTVSHELRTPLNVIIGYSEILRDGELGSLNREQGELFKRIDAQARELNELIESVLRVGKIESGNDVVVPAMVDTDTLIAAIESAVGHLPRREEVALRWQRSGDLRGFIETDAAKVGLVVRNLVGNALKFTDAGEVCIAIAAVGEELVLSISDTGSGIAQESLPRIFDMFRQADPSSDTPRGKGVGLGLYIVDQTVRRLGGRVHVTTQEGKGTTFDVRLPGFVRVALAQAG